MLQAKDLALITNTLQVPVIIGDVVANPNAFNDDLQYGLHDLLSEMQPDSALLSIALATKSICRSYAAASASMGIMEAECERVINEYAQLWLLNMNEDKVDSTKVTETLSYVSEDLECFIELLELNIEFLAAKDRVTAQIFEILLVQAQAQVLIAETFCNALEYAAKSDISSRIEEKSRKGSKFPIIAQTAINDAVSKTGNVVLFPSGK